MRVLRPNGAYAFVQVGVPKMVELGPIGPNKCSNWVYFGSKKCPIRVKLGGRVPNGFGCFLRGEGGLGGLGGEGSEGRGRVGGMGGEEERREEGRVGGEEGG